MKNSRCAAAFQPDILWAQVMIFSEWSMQPTNAQKYPSRNRPKCVCSKRFWTNSKGERKEEEKKKGFNGAHSEFFVWRREWRRSTAMDGMGNSTCVAVLIARQNSETHIAQTMGLQSQ